MVWNDDSSSTLTIYNANIDDAGIYKCVVTAEDGTESEATVNALARDGVSREVPCSALKVLIKSLTDVDLAADNR